MDSNIMAASAHDAQGNEVCAGCGAVAPATKVVENDQIVVKPGIFPIVGVGSPDLQKQTTATRGDGHPDETDMVAYPVCTACHVDPAHRTKDKLKVHFFERAMRKRAVIEARLQTMRE